MVTVMRSTLLLAVLISGGSIFIGRATRPTHMPTPELLPYPTFSSDDSSYFDIDSSKYASRFCLPDADEFQTVLVIRSHERPRDTSRFCVSITSAIQNDVRPDEWKSLETIARPSCAPDSIASLSETSPSIPITVIGVPTKTESWFLPSGASIHTEAAAIQTIEAVSSPRVRVVLDVMLHDDQALQATCKPFTARLNSVLIPLVEQSFGPLADRDSDQRLTVVVTPHVRQLQGGNTPVDAFVLASDYRLDLARPQSNESDAIYLHPDLLTKANDAVLIHELIHVAQFCSYRRKHGAHPWPLADWILEGTAHAGEVMLSGRDTNVRERIDAFAVVPERSPLRVVDSAREGLWRDARSRGAAASFFIETGRRYGSSALRQIITADVTDPQTWQSATGQTQEQIERVWCSSLIQSQTIRPHILSIDTPLVVDVQGESTAFVRLPEANSAREMSVQIQAEQNQTWTGWLHRQRRNGSSETSLEVIVNAASEPLSLHR